MTDRWARGRTTGTKDTLVHAVQLLSVFLRLQELALSRRVVVLQERLNRLVLLVEVGEIGDKILDDVHVRQRVDFRRGRGVLGDSAETCERVDSVNVHGAGSADTLPT